MTNVETALSAAKPTPLRRLLDACANLVTVIWRFFANPVLLLVVSAFAFLLVATAMIVPQMPDTLTTDPAAAARWILSTRAAYASTGGLLESLGIFNLLESELLRVLLVLIALMLAVQLGEQLGLALAMHQLARRAQAPVRIPTHGPVEAGAAPLNYGGVLYRLRTATPQAVDAVRQQVHDHLTTHFARIDQFEVAQREASAARIQIGADDDDVLQRDAAASTKPVADSETDVETRLLATGNRWFVYLRPLLLLGLLVGLFGFWLNVVFGWEVISPSLPPTEVYAYPLRDLAIEYSVPSAGAEGTEQETLTMPALQVRLGETALDVPVGADSVLGQTRIIVQPSAPALLIQVASSGLLLTRPGVSTQSVALGLEFPEPGREEFLVLPGESIGVRIVRQPDDDYAVEFYAADSSAPVATMTVDRTVQMPQIAPLPGSNALLTFSPTVSAATVVRTAPGDRFYWLAACLALVGAIGFVRNPTFLLAQIGVWSPAKSVLTAQSNVQGAPQALAARLLPEPATQDAIADEA